MLKTHFSASQFIVVSLKEGMFNNANVIFRTRFVDGVSAVGRTVNRAPSSNGEGGASTSAVGGARENQQKARKRGKRAFENGDNSVSG